jgi:hypothetical protein
MLFDQQASDVHVKLLPLLVLQILSAAHVLLLLSKSS